MNFTSDETSPEGVSVNDPSMSIEQAATYIGVSKATLYSWRTKRPGFGPRAVVLGGRISYRRSELNRWLDSHTENLDEPLGLAAGAEGDAPSVADSSRSGRGQAANPASVDQVPSITRQRKKRK